MNLEKQIYLIAGTLFASVFVGSFALIILGSNAAILGALLVPSLVISYLFPRWGLWAFLVYLPFAGTMTYAIGGVFTAIGSGISFTKSYALFHFVKDAFYFPALLAILVSHQVLPHILPKIKPLIIALSILLIGCLLTFVGVNLAQVFTESQDKVLLMGLIGLKVFLGYIPLVLCSYYLISNCQNLWQLNRVLTILIVICCTLCLVQYLFLVTGICAGSSQLPEPASTRASLQAQCFVGGSLLYNPPKGLIRLPGTFVSPWQWAWFLISSAFITYGVSVSDPSRYWRWISWGAIASVLVATIISGQRTAFLVVPLIYLILFLLTEKHQPKLPIKLGIIALITIVIVTQFGIVQEAIADFIGRWQYSPPQEFIAKQFQWLFNYRLEWLGNGLGRTASAARRLGDIQLIEVFYVKVLYEIGIVGFLAFLGVVTTLTILTFKAYRSLKTPSLRRLGLCLWIFILLISYNPYNYPLAVDPVAVYYWFVAGILLRLPELELSNG
ncbi:conserved hypothetical protein [Rippkaea orientalis PCC 8801]|uniref:O-antigen polymerase n=1 Tax=Rippkaea orientalis (strain PCC 8801 / RF-1) TaxID=41431 RepID=B7K694_RIPO1|nr:hypothetical protein [Rippkaea orientalis]ACK68147.1 conserved hypothetical protein [Rippkaea orientalis PCC 8801]